MALTIKDRTPFIRNADGSKDEIMLSARNVNMYEDGLTVQQEIEDLKETIDLLKETVETVRSENEILRTALETQMNNLRSSIENMVITKEKVVEALGYEPCERFDLTVFQGARQATTETPAVTSKSGLVPPAELSDTSSYLCGDGTWKRIDTSQFLTKTEADMYYLGKGDKAISAWQADVAQTAYNVPYTARGNIWIKENG